MINENSILGSYRWCTEPSTIRKEEYFFCKKNIEKLNLQMNLIQVNYKEDDNKLIFFFTAPERIDFRELLKILRINYKNYKIEIRQIGQRDAASLLGGFGICGRQLCCNTFLNFFYPISAKMAKKVGATPNPGMYCGVCGRLRCCLRYEEDFIDDEKNKKEEDF